MALRPAEKTWFLGSVGLVLFWLAVLVLAPYLKTVDPWIYARTLVSRGLALYTACIVITAMALLIDRITPGDWHEEVRKGNIACAIVLGSIYYGLYQLFTWAQS